jgi:hypothetical protein
VRRIAYGTKESRSVSLGKHGGVIYLHNICPLELATPVAYFSSSAIQLDVGDEDTKSLFANSKLKPEGVILTRDAHRNSDEFRKMGAHEHHI